MIKIDVASFHGMFVLNYSRYLLCTNYCLCWKGWQIAGKGCKLRPNVDEASESPM